MLINNLSIKLNRGSNTGLREENVLYHDTFITAILAGNDPFLTKQHYIVQRKRFIIQPKYITF